jgi:ornithine decarboxylase
LVTLPRLQRLAAREGTPLLIIDHDVIRANFLRLRKRLPRVQVYYAMKANPEPTIIQTLHEFKSGYDVASLQEYQTVLENIPKKDLRGHRLNDFIWDKIIVANTIKPIATLQQITGYNTLMTFDNQYELEKIKRHCPDAGLVCRLRVQNVGSVVELSSKFGVEPGDAANLIDKAFETGLVVEGLSFHVGSQCTNIDNYLNALEASAEIFKEVRKRGHKMRLLNIGGGFPVPYDRSVPEFEELAKKLRKEIDRLFSKSIQILAEPGRFIVATAATLIVEVVGKSFRDDKWVYYINDGVYGTLSGVIFDHIPYHFHAFKRGDKRLSAVVGPTCDALDTVSTAEMLPELDIGDLLYVRNCGAYTNGSATTFNGFPKTKILNINA